MSVSYLNDSYLDEAQKDLVQHDPDLSKMQSLLKQRVLAGAQLQPGQDQNGYSKVDLKPEWYKSFLKKKGYEQDGPPVNSTFGDVANAGLQAGAAGAQANADRFAKMPGARAPQIMDMQSKANAAGILSGVLGALINKKSSDFDQQQSRAVKDASALSRKAKTGVSTNELQNYLNYDKTLTRNEQLARRDAEKNASVIVNADPNSKESKDSQKAFVGAGVIEPEAAGQLSKEQLKDTRTALMQTQGQRNKTDEFDYETSVNQGNKYGEEERSEVRRIEGEQRDAQQARLRAQVPGFRWANDTPPDPATQTKAREFATAQHDLVQGAREMKSIQDQLIEIGRKQGARPEGLGPAAFGQTIDKYIGDEQSKQLLARAALVQQKMVTAARKDDNLGVLQQFEKAMEDAINPTAGTIGAYFKGSAPWDQIASYYTTYGDDKLRKMGLFHEGDDTRPQGGDTLMQKPATEQVTTFARPKAPRPHAGRAQTASTRGGEGYDAQPGDSLGGAQPVPPIPADARKPAAPVRGPGLYYIQVNGKKTRPRSMSLADIQQAEATFGQGSVQPYQQGQ